jgi:hypothetical protein
MMRPDLARKPENRSRFITEAQAAASLRKDHIIDILHAAKMPLRVTGTEPRQDRSSVRAKA